jgi:hypothetical protein
MKRPMSSILAAAAASLVALALAVPPSLAARQSAPAPPDAKATAYSAHYRIHFLDSHAAEQLAWDQCPGKDCRISWQSGELELFADAATHERLARALTQADEPHTQSFQLTLLAADNHGDGAAAELPKAAQKALQDMKDFLPFKSYRLLDMAWLRTTGSAEAQLAGDQGKSYGAELHFSRVGDPAAGELLIENFVIRPGLIKTTFAMHVGETVVVGTSKLGGNTAALVVLLTAVP